MNARPLFRLGAFGLSWMGRGHVRPRWEVVCREYWYIDALGFSLWRDALPAVTVGERGAW